MWSLADNLFLAAGDLMNLLPFCEVEQAVKAEPRRPRRPAKHMTRIRARVWVNFP